ncbi:MAG: secretin N-terminal domain-containing protein, partial [Candidatus Hydrogenedentes bacterium]|nr:secretin N-terminal domain-containing protein [Candidatus Hydrogenedentota bacterium]
KYGPLPGDEEDITMSMFGPMTVTDFVSHVQENTMWNVAVTEAASTIRLHFYGGELSPKQAMKLLQLNGIYYDYDNQSGWIVVKTVDEYLRETYGSIIEEVFLIKHVDLGDVEEVLTALSSEEGMIIVDNRTSMVTVRDTADNLEVMRRTVHGLDHERGSQTFTLRHIEAEALIDSLETVLSEGGETLYDPRTNVLVVTDLKSRQKRIAAMVEQFDRELVTRDWTLNYADPLFIADELELLVPEDMGSITVNEPTRQISVTATRERIDVIDERIRVWDRMRKQVQIQAYLVTASSNVARNLGVNWSYFGMSGDDPIAFQVGGQAGNPFAVRPPGSGGQQVSLGQLPTVLGGDRGNGDDTNGAVTKISDAAGNPIIRNIVGGDVSAMLDLLEATGDVTVLAQPRVTVLDGQGALFGEKTQVPYAQSSTSSNFNRNLSNNGYNSNSNFLFPSRSTIQFIDVGTILSVYPVISEEGNILLDIDAEDSSFIMVLVVGSDQNNSVPQKTENRIETQVMVHDGSTIVIGGLRTSNFTDNVDKVPFLADIPLIGNIFKSTKKEHVHNELLVFITPTIVDEYTQPESLRLAKAEAGLARTIRHDQKNAFERASERLSGGRIEVLIAVGPSGELFSENKMVTLDELRRRFFQFPDPVTTRVVIRKYPGAPSEVVTQLTEIALEAELGVDFDDTVMPFVPDFAAKEIHLSTGQK